LIGHLCGIGESKEQQPILLQGFLEFLYTNFNEYKNNEGSDFRIKEALMMAL